MSLNPDFGSTFSGVLTDEQGRVQAIWGSFSTQVNTSYSPLAVMQLGTYIVERHIWGRKSKDNLELKVLKVIIPNIKVLHRKNRL